MPAENSYIPRLFIRDRTDAAAIDTAKTMLNGRRLFDVEPEAVSVVTD